VAMSLFARRLSEVFYSGSGTCENSFLRE
jgi:hypothetical protein